MSTGNYQFVRFKNLPPDIKFTGITIYYCYPYIKEDSVYVYFLHNKEEQRVNKKYAEKYYEIIKKKNEFTK